MTITEDKRIGRIIWLLCAACIAGLGFWYPEGVMNRNSGPDDRSGFVLMVGMPFYLVGGIIGVRAILGLIANARTERSPSSRGILAAGAVLTIFSLTPLIIIGCRLLLI